MKSNPFYRNPSKQSYCFFNWRPKGILAAVASLLAAGAVVNSHAADVTMNAGDAYGQSSFNTAIHWDSGAAPTSGNNYYTGPYILRSPNSGTNYLTFAGDSLTVSPGGALYSKMNNITLVINTLTNTGRAVNANGATFTLVGNMYVPPDTGGGGMDTGSGNTSVNDVRTIANTMTIRGTGALTNYTSETAGTPQYWLTARGIVIYSGTNTAFTGPQVITKNTIVRVSSQANLGGNPASFNPAQLEFNNGILQPTASFALNNPNSGITVSAGGGSFDIASGLILTNANALAGAGTLSMTNTGTLVQQGTAASFTGTLSVGGGSLVLAAGGSLAGANTLSIGSAGTLDVTAAGITLANGQTLAGNGTVLGTVTSSTGSVISPGGSGVAASLSLGGLTLSGGGTLAFDFSTTNDVIVVGGNLSPSGVTSIQLLNVPSVDGDYPLITVGGTLGGTAANFQVAALSTRSKTFSIVYDQVSTPKRVLLHVVSGGAAASLVWQGDGVGNYWDITTSANWLNGGSPDVYYDADIVNFTEAGAANPPVLDVVVNPGAVLFNSSSDYTLSGLGAIAGPAALTKGGTGLLNLSVNNTYVGGTAITNGVLLMGVTNALGTPPGSTPLAVISGTGTLDINGMGIDAAFTNVVRINGHGFSATQGAIDTSWSGLSSGGGDVGLASVELMGDSTISANGNWQIGNTGAGIIGHGYTLTKTGNSYLYLKKAAASPLGKFVIAGGGVLFWDRADAVGPTTTIVLTNGGFIDTWNPATYYGGMTFANPLVVSDPVNGGMIINIRTPYNHPPADIFNGSVALSGMLTFSNVAYVAANQYNNYQNAFGKITMNGNITGTGGVAAVGGTTTYLGSGAPEYYGGNQVVFTGNNSYSGPTLVSNLIWLLTTTANQSGGAYHVVDYGTLDIAVAAGKPTMPMSSLTIESYNLGPANLGFTRLSGMPTSPVIHVTNLTIYAGVILPPVAGYSNGQFPLIKYEGTIGGSGFDSLQLGSLPAGVTASLSNNAANKTIDLVVTTSGIVWKGNVSSDWDNFTANWYNPVTTSAEYFADGQTVVFDDTATRFTVNLTGTMQPGGVTVNATNDYSFNGNNLAGAGALIKNGSGTLTVSSTNNLFTGGTFINGGTVKLADQNFVYPYGGGALNNALGNVTVANGGTLDINAIQVPNYQSYGPEGYNVFISGAGVGGTGALVNNSTNSNDLADPGYVTLTGNATVGGIGDVNIRHGVSPQLSSQSGNYVLTKVGTGQFRIRYVTAVSTNFGAINILQGNLTYESSSPLGFGDPTKPITIGSGAGFAWGTAVTPCQRPLVCSNGATIYALNGTGNVFAGPVTLDSGLVNLNANYYNGMTFSNVISGAGGLTLQYQGYATLAAANTYTGPTTVANCNAGSGSVLRLVGSGSINNSSGITLLGIATGQALPGALDASGRSDGTLTLVNGQTLRGDNGSYVSGNVVATTGTTVSPGTLATLQSMTCSNNLTLQAGSTVTMQISLDGGATNDQIRVVGAASYGGTLQLANIGATALTNGASFKLFNAGSYSGNFASVTDASGTTWSFTPATGIATVLSVPSSIPTYPTNMTFSVSGGQLTLKWPASHLGWSIQSNAVDVTQPSFWFNVPGSEAVTQMNFGVDATRTNVFYRMHYLAP